MLSVNKYLLSTCYVVDTVIWTGNKPEARELCSYLHLSLWRWSAKQRKYSVQGSTRWGHLPCSWDSTTRRGVEVTFLPQTSHTLKRHIRRGKTSFWLQVRNGFRKMGHAGLFSSFKSFLQRTPIYHDTSNHLATTESRCVEPLQILQPKCQRPVSYLMTLLKVKALELPHLLRQGGKFRF